MAYMSPEKKQEMATKLKSVLKGSGLKYTLSVYHHSTIVMKITKGPIDFIKNYTDVLKRKQPVVVYAPIINGYMDVNPYWYKEQFTGFALETITKIMEVLNTGNHDHSDIQSDYVDVGWYVSVKIGTREKPYQLVRYS